MSSESKLLDQGIITFPGLGDVLVMVFSDCVMYVRCDLVDGAYAHFNPEDWLSVERGRVSPESLIPIADNRKAMRSLLMCDYAYKLNRIN